MLTALERGKTPSEAAYCIFIPYDVCDLEQNRALKIFNIGAQPCIRNRCFQVLIYFDMATFVGNEAHRFLALRLRVLLDRDQWQNRKSVVSGKRVAERVDHGGRRIIKKKKKEKTQ